MNQNSSIISTYSALFISSFALLIFILMSKSKSNKLRYLKRIRTAAYHSWTAMMQRCHNTNHGAYKDYGGRGILVCEKWRGNFKNFLKDMGEPPEPGYSLDRIDPEQGYYKENCRWATSKEQASNRRVNKKLSPLLIDIENVLRRYGVYE